LLAGQRLVFNITQRLAQGRMMPNHCLTGFQKSWLKRCLGNCLTQREVVHNASS
jgi:hypothetical protein